jgi:hypothetical protein
MGGSIALLAALDLKIHLNLTSDRVFLYAFGQSRVGDEAFADYVF